MSSRDEAGLLRPADAGGPEARQRPVGVADPRGAPTSETIEDAWRWLQTTLGGRPVPALVAVIGMSGGELLLALNRRAPGTRVLALEPDPANARVLLSRPEVQSWTSAGRLICLSGPAYAGADEAWRIFPANPDDHVILVAPALAREGGAAAVDAARTLKRIVFGARANAEARRQLAPRYLANSLRNAGAIVRGRDVRELANAYRGLPAVIAAAGPSLDHALDDLRAVAGRALLVSVDTALRPLLSSGLRPHLAVGLDPSEINARHFHALPACPDTWLVSESALDASAHRHFGDRTFWFRVAPHEPWPWYNELGVDVGLLEVWGSVVTAAFQVAMLAGCDPIVMVGADLSYAKGQPYARGTTYELDWARWAALGTDVDDVWRAWAAASEPIRMADVGGRETSTTPALLAFRNWLLAHAARSGRRVVNATGAGLFFGDGIEQLPLTKAITTRRVVSSPADATGPTPRAVRDSDLAARFRELGVAIAHGDAEPVAARWRDFIGGSWSPAATAADLHDAADLIEKGPSSSSGKCLALTRPITHLPEGVARWRSALAGAAPLPPPAEQASDAATLIDAFGLLEHVCLSLVRSPDDLPFTVQAGDIGRLPFTGLYPWPADAAWAVAVFEGLLGAALRFPFLEPQDSFFERGVLQREAHTAPSDTDAGWIARPNAALACVLLALEWVACARSVDAPAADEFNRFASWLRAARPSLRVPDQARGEEADAVLALSTGRGELRQSVELPVSFRDADLARVDTGTMAPAPTAADANPASVELLARVDLPGRAASIVLRRGKTSAAGGDRLRPNVLRLTPRVLTDEGVARSNIVYATPRGAVCVTPFAESSFVIREDGSIEPGHTWPRPIVNEIPFGPDGLVAWSNGAQNWASPEPGYVMHRQRAATPVVITDLAFRPTWGAWWRDRLYWSCYAHGVGSWAPGSDPALAWPDETIISVDADERGLILSPCLRHETGYVLRRRVSHAWRWDGDGALEALPLGPFGAATARSSSADGWQAAAYPEADVVRLESADGPALSMTCFQPFKLAWLERSLLVSTYHGELLLFPQLAHLLSETA